MKKIFLVLILGAVLIFGYQAYQKEMAKPKNYNVIFFVFDGLQAKHLKTYGYNRDLTPNLDKFLSSSYLFKNSISPSSWTVPSHMSIFTSMYPSEHKVTNKFSEFDQNTQKGVVANLKKLTPSALTITEILKQNGYTTGGFTGDAGVGRQFGFGQGFDEYYDSEVFGGLDGSIPRALDWLKKNREKKFFLFVHGYDVHGQHAPKEGFDYRFVEKGYKGLYTGSPKEQGALREEGLKNGALKLSDEDVKFWRAVYDEKINRADMEFKNFFDEVKKMGVLENTLVVVFSDHGTEFMEHDKFDHGHTLYTELTNVLFSLHLPGQKEGKTIDSLVSTIDVLPTVLKILNLKNPVPEQTKGMDLTKSFFGEDVSRNIFTETDYRLYTHKRAVQRPDGMKFILTVNEGFKELYDLKKDPGEKNNLAEKEQKTAYEMEQMLYGHMKDMGASGPFELGCAPVYGDQCK